MLLAQLATSLVVELVFLREALDGVELTDPIDRFLRELGLAPFGLDELEVVRENGASSGVRISSDARAQAPDPYEENAKNAQP